jgi:hypothetical protein
MAEIKQAPIEHDDGSVTFTEVHTISDIIRYAVKCSDVGTVAYIVNKMIAEMKG